jgi:hypothetical protein
MTTPTVFIFGVECSDAAKITIKHIKYHEKEFTVIGNTSIYFESFTSWAMPTRFIINNISSVPVTVTGCNLLIGNQTIPSRYFLQKKNNNDLFPERTEHLKVYNIYGFAESGKNIFVPMIIEPNDIAEIQLGQTLIKNPME